jgi:hypothetical protein
MRINKEQIAADFQKIQDYICQELEAGDGKAKFKEDKWDRPEGGGGRTRIIQDGNIIEKGGVAFSAVNGPSPDKILKKLKLEESDFFATGVSIVIHPKSPMVPIIHMNIRYFEMSNGVYWFGGGIDLTPHYVVEEDAQYFHRALKETCDEYDPTFYPKFKKWADDYFFIRHRNEMRGVGAGDPVALPHAVLLAGTVRPRERPVREHGHTHRGPVEAAVTQVVLRECHVPVVVHQARLRDRAEHVAHHPSHARVATWWVRAVRGRHGRETCHADHHNAPNVAVLHRRDDGLGSARDDAVLGLGPGSQPGQHRVRTAHSGSVRAGASRPRSRVRPGGVHTR